MSFEHVVPGYLRVFGLGLAAACGLQCGSGPSITAPSDGQMRALPVLAIAPPRPLPALIGAWQGSSTVDSTFGTLPSCVAPFWRNGFSDRIAALARPFDAGPLDMTIEQGSAESCHLQAGGSPDNVVAGPWLYDEFDCALVPSVCGLSCHFQLNASQWGCAGTPPEVWILGMRVAGVLAAADRLSGTIEIAYDHRQGGGPYTRATVLKRFEMRRAVEE